MAHIQTNTVAVEEAIAEAEKAAIAAATSLIEFLMVH